MNKYDCKNCVHNGKGGVSNRNKKCKHCTVDSKDIYGKPSNYKEKENNMNLKGEKDMKKQYYVQVNDYMTPVQVMLTEEEANTVAYVLEEIAKGDKDALVGIIGNEDGNELYGNYEEWIKTHKKLGEAIMTKTININTIREKELVNKNGKVFHIIEVKPEVIFILDENNNFIDSYCGSIDEDEDNLRVINQR